MSGLVAFGSAMQRHMRFGRSLEMAKKAAASGKLHMFGSP